VWSKKCRLAKKSGNHRNVHKILCCWSSSWLPFLVEDTWYMHTSCRHVFLLLKGGPRFPHVSPRRCLRKSIFLNPIRPMQSRRLQPLRGTIHRLCLQPAHPLTPRAHTHMRAPRVLKESEIDIAPPTKQLTSCLGGRTTTTARKQDQAIMRLVSVKLPASHCATNVGRTERQNGKAEWKTAGRMEGAQNGKTRAAGGMAKWGQNGNRGWSGKARADWKGAGGTERWVEWKAGGMEKHGRGLFHAAFLKRLEARSCTSCRPLPKTLVATREREREREI